MCAGAKTASGAPGRSACRQSVPKNGLQRARIGQNELRPKSWTQTTIGMKKHNYPERVAAMRMLADGHSISHVEKKTGIYHFHLYRLWEKYNAGGELALLDDKPRRRTYEEKLLIMRDLVEKGVSLKTVSIKFDVCISTLKRWRKMYIEKGPEGLVSQRDSMPKKRRTAAELDELEMLRKRNEYLEAENALLKKVKALVEEREARLRAIGRGPSKN